ncbi:MFS transporter [Streptomyces sp. NPDC002643]
MRRGGEPRLSSAAAPDAVPQPSPPSGAAPTRRRDTFSSLKIRNYRLYAAGAVVSNTGTWFSRIAQDWLVLSLTGSSFAVGITTAMQFLPVLLVGLYGGVIADRYSRRKLLLAAQSAMGLFGLPLAVLTLTGHVQVWHVYTIAFLSGMAAAVCNPARHAFVAELVGPADVRNAVALNSASLQSTRLIGPAVAGLLITTVGSGWALLFNALSYGAPVTGLLLMRTSELHAVERVPRAKGQLREGLSYVARHPGLIWPITLVGFIGTFAFNFPVWLSAFALTVWHGDASAYGLFNSFMAIGSLTGALLAARRGVVGAWLLTGSAIGFGMLEVAAALSPWYWLFVLLLAPLGALGLTFNTTANASIQLAAEPALRGRVMSLFTMVFVGGTPISGPIIGWVTDAHGARVSLLSGGLIAAASAAGIGIILARAGTRELPADDGTPTGRGPAPPPTAATPG